MGILKGRFLWPGVIAPTAGTYTISHGIAPGTAILECLPQQDLPETFGDLIITDNETTIRIPDCKIDKIRKVQKGEGFVWILEILDWRWKWTDLGMIEGWYNQLDQFGKLRPYTIRSPTELAQLCFEAMGVSKYLIDLPPGLSKAQGENLNTLNPIWLTGNSTGTNPPVNWEGEAPALALSNLVHQYGRHIVPRLSDYTIMVVIPGIGDELPPGSIAKRTPTLDSPETPGGVAVLGDYTRYQVRLLLEAVGEDWNGRYLPIKDVSYAPRGEVIRQVTIIEVGDLVDQGTTYIVNITFWKVTGNAGGGQQLPTEVTKTFVYTTDVDDINDNVINALYNEIIADTDIQDAGIEVEIIDGVSPDPDTLQITGQTSGDAFIVTVSTDEPTNTIRPRTTPGFNPNKPWRNLDLETCWAAQTEAGVPFDNDRLTYFQAVELARKSIFKCYRLSDISVNGGRQINVPGFGKLVRKEQLILTDHQVEQIQPEVADQTLKDRRGEPYLENLYNGYSRDKPASVFGRIATQLQLPQWSEVTGDNTAAGSQVFIPFAIDNLNWLIKFASPVAIWRAGGWEEPERLVLQCAVMVRNAHTNAIERYKNYRINTNLLNTDTFATFTKTPGGVTRAIVRKYPDVQMNVIGFYDLDNENVLSFTRLEDDPILRAKYYLDGMQSQYFPVASETAEYNGFVAQNLDGAISQITWEFPVREGGCGTTISRNTEHEVNVPPYHARRRAENLSVGSQENAINVPSVPHRDNNNRNDSMWVRPPGFEH